MEPKQDLKTLFNHKNNQIFKHDRLLLAHCLSGNLYTLVIAVKPCKGEEVMYVSKICAGRCVCMVLIYSVLGSGCIHTSHIHSDSIAAEQDQINDDLSGKNAQIELFTDSIQRSAEDIYLSADSLYYTDTKTGQQNRITVTKVHKIVTRNHGRGAVEGLAGGLLTSGGLVGIALLMKGDEADPPEEGPGEGSFVFVSMLAAVPLTIAGTIIGATSGSKQIYIFNKKQDDSFQHLK